MWITINKIGKLFYLSQAIILNLGYYFIIMTDVLLTFSKKMSSLIGEIWKNVCWRNQRLNSPTSSILANPHKSWCNMWTVPNQLIANPLRHKSWRNMWTVPNQLIANPLRHLRVDVICERSLIKYLQTPSATRVDVICERSLIN